MYKNVEIKTWLIGTGNMGKEYAKVLSALQEDYIAVGRGEESAASFEAMTGHPAVRGGLADFLQTRPAVPDRAIVAVNIEQLAAAALQLLDYGVKEILLEKPGFGNIADLEELTAAIDRTEGRVFLAYNRRFYSSVLKAEEIIRQDGGVMSFHFEFTEWAHTIKPENYAKVVLDHWLLGNSSHVIDTAFFLGGHPREISCYRSGGLSWHPAASVFAGAGVSDHGALFSYCANWEAPGRWAVEILTKKHRLYLKPMESLQIQDIGSVAVNPVEIDDRLDKEFKPGFYLQTQAFIKGDYARFCSVGQQKEHIEHFYLQMSGYER